MLYNANKHSRHSYMTEKVRSMLQKRYPYAKVIVKPLADFNYYAQSFRKADCYPEGGKNNCPGGKFDFTNLKSGLE